MQGPWRGAVHRGERCTKIHKWVGKAPSSKSIVGGSKGTRPGEGPRQYIGGARLVPKEGALEKRAEEHPPQYSHTRSMLRGRRRPQSRRGE